MNTTVGRTDHVEVTIDDLFVEHYDPPRVPPKTSAAMKGPRRHRVARGLRRGAAHPVSLVALGLAVGALGGIVVFKRWFA